ncbi:MAG: MipA/OmpV family protein [Gammaproteobacteria bacterium]|jgi:outer membrane scaffolding protein for murein synthesis (MipA/OmpV family)|nr:MipA/OmpV family protein [Gammaproteobacteria bacterium]
MNLMAEPLSVRPGATRLFGVALWVIASLCMPRPAHAAHLPLWELGIGIGSLNTPHYRGSESDADLLLPFPYVIYRGSFLQIDREDGVRGKLFNSEDIRVELSLAGNVPVPDTDGGARSDMDALDPLLEVGAELIVDLWRGSDGEHSFGFNVPLRLVYSVGDPLLEFQGVTVSPYFNYRIRQEDHGALLRYNASFGPIFASSRYNDYFYEVNPEFVTPQRAEYHADSGYGGSRVTLSVTRHAQQYMVGAFARYDNLDGAVFADSPLVETRDYFIFGLVFAWILGASDETVAH